MSDTLPQEAPPPTDGAALLNDVEAFHRRFNIFPTEAAYVAVALWDAHAHLLDCFDSTPASRFCPPSRAAASRGRWKWSKPWCRARWWP